MDNTTIAFILIALGFLFMVAELFLPTGGAFHVAAAAFMAVGVWMAFYFGDYFTGLLALTAAIWSVPVGLILFLTFWQKTKIARLMGASDEQTPADDEPAPGVSEKDTLRGRYGKAVSPLRPAGVAEFDGRRVDVLSEGPMIEANTWVRCIDVRGGKVVVRPMDPPKLDDLDPNDFS